MSQRRSDFCASSDPLRVASPKLQVAELAIFTDEEVFNEDGVSFLTFFRDELFIEQCDELIFRVAA